MYAIAMYQKNHHEGYAFMNLETGSLIHSNNWTQLPITQQVIERVETIAKEMINVIELLVEIDKSLNNEIQRNVQHQEDFVDKNINNDTNSEENNNNNHLDKPEAQQDQDINELKQPQDNEHPRDFNGILIIDPDTIAEDSIRNNMNDTDSGSLVDDLSMIEQLSD